MWVVGLTGGMGSGKTTVATLFEELGVPIIDTDRIAHQLTVPGGEALAEIRNQFSSTVFQADGALDRAALRRLVFKDETARKQLEAILHPRIRQEVVHTLATMPGPYAMVVVPLLVETQGYREWLNRVLVVDCPEALQIERVMSRSRLQLEEVEAILAAQASRIQRLVCADDVILNDGPPSALRAEVENLHRHYLVLANQATP